MRLLIITQTIDQNDPVLGFMQRWVAEFATQCDEVLVLCLKKGLVKLPDNVRVFSLGKELGVSRLVYLWNFFRIIWRERNAYDTVFVHMNQIYILLGGVIWRALGKKVGLWYAHGHVPFSLRVAEKITQHIFTSTTSGCRLNSKKIQVVGQGIDTNYFVPALTPKNTSHFNLVAVGRISPVKDYETFLRAVVIFRQAVPTARVLIIGGAGTPEQEKYVADLKKLRQELGLNEVVDFVGPSSHSETRSWFQRADIFVNTSHTGSLDKAILEAMACGVPILTCNEALSGVLGAYAATLMFDKKNSEQLGERLNNLYRMGSVERAQLGDDLRNLVVREHSLSSFVKKIVFGYQAK